MRRIKAWIDRAVSAVRRRTLSQRLYAAGILVCILPLLVVGISGYRMGSESITAMAERLISQAVRQTANVVGTKLQIVINDGVDIAYSDLVQNSLPAYDGMTAREKMQLEQSLQELINRKYIYNSYDCEIMLYTLDHSEVYAYGPQYFRFHLSAPRLEEVLEQAEALWGQPLWRTVDETWEQHVANQSNIDRNSLLLCRAIKSLNSGSIIGYLMIRLDEREISRLFSDIDLGEGTLVFILDQDGAVVSSDRSFTPGETFSDPGLPRRLASGGGKPFLYDYMGESYVAAYAGIVQAGWYIAVLAPVSYLTTEPAVLLRATMLVIFVCALAVFALFGLVSMSVIRPVRSLQGAMEAFGKKTDAPPIPEEGHDEITALTRQFNDMTREIAMLIEDVSRHEREKHELETKALQAQINPHFLANTLDTVIYMAHIKGEKNIEEVLLAIINMLNYCKRNDTALTTVRDSVAFLKSYELVQSYRMLGRFTMLYQIDERILDCLMPRFLLQPIVENALIHGVEPSDRMGQITLKGVLLEDAMRFSVTDNGVGMSREQIDAVLREAPDARHHLTGIGIGNVQRRLRLMYGEDFGLHINSVRDVFTTVELVIPLRREKEAADA